MNFTLTKKNPRWRGDLASGALELASGALSSTSGGVELASGALRWTSGVLLLASGALLFIRGALDLTCGALFLIGDALKLSAMFPTFTAVADFRGQTREWTLEVRDGTLEFWDATREQPQQWRFGVWHPIHARDVAAWTRPALELLWRDAIETERVGRRVAMSDELTAFLLVRGRFESRSHSHFNFRGKHRRARVKGAGYNHMGLFEHPLIYWESRLEEQAIEFGNEEWDGLGKILQDAGVSFSVWRKIGLARDDLDFDLRRGNLEELAQVSQWIWNLEPNWIAELSRQARKMTGASASLLLRPDKPARLLLMAHCKDGYTHYGNHPRAQLWDAMLRYFEPRPRVELYRDEIENGARLFEREFPLPCFDEAFENHCWRRNSASTLSAHEQLELRLPLSNWLRNRAGLSDERIAELLF